MAKQNLSATYKNCDVSLKDLTFTEISKDNTEVFNIMDELKKWDGQSGVDITFKKSSDIIPSEDGDEAD